MAVPKISTANIPINRMRRQNSQGGFSLCSVILSFSVAAIITSTPVAFRVSALNKVEPLKPAPN